MTLLISNEERAWRMVAPGIEMCRLRRHGDGSPGQTFLLRMQRGARAPLHDHPGGEETLVISGRLRIGDRVLGPGDYLWTEPGAVHDGIAEEDDTVFFNVLPAGFQIQL